VKVHIDTFLGEEGNYFDTSFLQKRKSWLPHTGIYLEFILKGLYDQRIDFKLSTGSSGILIKRHSWNRFFLNIKDSGIVVFELIREGKPFMKSEVSFDVVNIEVPLLLSVPSLLKYSISEIRYFANRLSENLVNGTRFVLFSSSFLDDFSKNNCELKEDSVYLRLFELVLSILTERGIIAFVSPFDLEVPYTLSLIQDLKKALLFVMEKEKKFRIVWDLSTGLRKREQESLVDSVFHKLGREVPLVVSQNCFSKLGGEGFCYYIQKVKQEEIVPQNEKGVKVAQFSGKSPDFYSLRSFSQRMTKLNWGVEYVCPVEKGVNLKKLQYSLGKALSQGYFDVERD